MGPPPVVFPLLLLLLTFVSLFSPAISQYSSPLSSSSTSSSECQISAIPLTAIDPQVTLSLTNLSYYSITMPPTAPSGFKLRINQRGFESRTCAFEVFEGDELNTCPGPKNHLRSAHGQFAEFFIFNQTTKPHYFSLHAVNCTSTQVTFQINAICPNFCVGPGAHCSPTTGCFCANNYYNPLEGCFVTGQCDPTASYPYICAVENGYGNQTCNIDPRTNTTYLGLCKVAGCEPEFFLDVRANSCKRRPPPPAPPGYEPVPETRAWWRVGSLGSVASVLIWCAEALAVLVVLGVAVFFVVRRRNTQFQYHKYDSEDGDELQDRL